MFPNHLKLRPLRLVWPVQTFRLLPVISVVSCNFGWPSQVLRPRLCPRVFPLLLSSLSNRAMGVFAASLKKVSLRKYVAIFTCHLTGNYTRLALRKYFTWTSPVAAASGSIICIHYCVICMCARYLYICT